MARNTDPLLTLPDKSGVLYVRLYQRMRALILGAGGSARAAAFVGFGSA